MSVIQTRVNWKRKKETNDKWMPKSKPCLPLSHVLCVHVPVSPSVMTHGTAISPLYRFTLSDGTALSAQTRCKFCCPPNPDVQPFIMGIHTIDRYDPFRRRSVSHFSLCHTVTVILCLLAGNTTLLALRKTLTPAFHPPLAALPKLPPAPFPFLPAATGPRAQASPPRAFTLTIPTPPPTDTIQPHLRAT